MLNEHGVEFENREYTQAPLSQAEIRDVLGKLNMGPRDVLRGRDAKKAGLSGQESDDELIARYAPTAAWNDPRFTPALGREHELMSLESGDSKIRITFEINEGSETAEP